MSSEAVEGSLFQNLKDRFFFDSLIRMTFQYNEFNIYKKGDKQNEQ